MIFFKGFLSVPVDHLESQLEKQRIHFVSMIAALAALLMLIHSMFMLWNNAHDFNLAIYSHVINIFMMFLVILLNKNGWFYAAKILLSIYIPITLSFFSIFLFSKEFNFQLLLLVSVQVPLFIWGKKDLKYLLLFILFYFMLFIGIEYFPHNNTKLIQTSESYIDIVKNFNLAFSILGFMLAIIIYQLISNKSEKEIARKDQENKQIMKIKDKLYSIVAHDLKGPISSLAGLADYLIKETKPYNNASLDRLSLTMDQTLKSTYVLLENLLTWSKLQLSLNFRSEKPVKVLPCVKETLSFFNILIVEKEQKTKLNIPENLSLKFEKHALCTIVRNLISNAIKYTPHRGEISISAKTKADFIEICVKDSGIGMDSEAQQNLFNDGVIQSMPGTSNEPGSGLGLIICKEFIEKNQGKIWVESEPNMGSKFYFTLPIA